MQGFFNLLRIQISIHALLAESDTWKCGWYVPVSISIHALLAESDKRANSLPDTPPQISIHALLAESDRNWTHWPTTRRLFLSTLSLRRATAVTTLGAGSVKDFYPRSPCGERPVFPCFIIINVKISIHALLAESDLRMLKQLASI